MTALRSFGLLITDGQTVGGLPLKFILFSSHRTFGIPNLFIIVILIAVPCYFLLHRSRWGRYLFAVGSNAGGRPPVRGQRQPHHLSRLYRLGLARLRRRRAGRVPHRHRRRDHGPGLGIAEHRLLRHRRHQPVRRGRQRHRPAARRDAADDHQQRRQSDEREPLLAGHHHRASDHRDRLFRPAPPPKDPISLMKTVVCDRPGSLSLIERPAPRPAPGEALLRIRRVGVCGTDYHILGGRQPFLSYPRVMGHELGAEVVEAPAGSGLTPGMAVVVVPYLSCGTCRACRRGLTNCCRRISVLGVHQDGGMAEYLAVPVTNIVPAPNLSLDQAAMVEFLAIGAHGVRRGAITPEDRVLVVGAGPIGMAALIFARARGAAVTVMDLRADRLEFAQAQLGAAGTVIASDQAQAELAALTDGEFFDVVIDATGHAPSIARGLSYVGHGGRYVLLSIVQDDISLP